MSRGGVGVERIPNHGSPSPLPGRLHPAPRTGAQEHRSRGHRRTGRTDAQDMLMISAATEHALHGLLPRDMSPSRNALEGTCALLAWIRVDMSPAWNGHVPRSGPGMDIVGLCPSPGARGGHVPWRPLRASGLQAFRDQDSRTSSWALSASQPTHSSSSGRIPAPRSELSSRSWSSWPPAVRRWRTVAPRFVEDTRVAAHPLPAEVRVLNLRCSGRMETA